MPRSSSKIDNADGDNKSIAGFIKYCIKNKSELMNDFNESHEYAITDIKLTTGNLKTTNGAMVAAAVIVNPIFAAFASRKETVDCIKVTLDI